MESSTDTFSPFFSRGAFVYWTCQTSNILEETYDPTCLALRRKLYLLPSPNYRISAFSTTCTYDFPKLSGLFIDRSFFSWIKNGPMKHKPLIEALDDSDFRRAISRAHMATQSASPYLYSPPTPAETGIHATIEHFWRRACVNQQRLIFQQTLV